MSNAELTERGLAQQLTAFSTSVLSDALGCKGVIAPGFNRYSGTGVMAGRAVTAKCAPGSLNPVFAALEQAGAGDVLCIEGPGNTAYLGDLLAGNIANRGLAGAVIDGLIRDRAIVAGMDITVMARGLTPANWRRQDEGEPMVSLTMGGVAISPGDWIVADDDGVVVIAPMDVEPALARARQHQVIEVRIRELIASGMKVPDAVQQALSEQRE